MGQQNKWRKQTWQHNKNKDGPIRVHLLPRHQGNLDVSMYDKTNEEL
jgi:hypothetical protein